MKVYRWEETPNHWLAVVRPDRLFDLSTRQPESFSPDFREGTQKARNRVTGEVEPFAYVFNKRFGEDDSDRRSVELLIGSWPDRYRAPDEESLARLDEA